MGALIEAILFDMGGTLRRTVEKKDGTKLLFAAGRILELLDAKEDPAEFARLLSERAQAYKEWAETTLLELNEADLWTRWMLPDWPVGKVVPIALQLNQFWRDASGVKVVFHETREVVIELFRRGYRLGLVSNTTSSAETPRVLQELGIAGCFDTVILSCVVGIRKPDPSILLMAAGQMGIRPEFCAYIGDQLCRDVTTARQAGFSSAIILRDPRQLKLERGHDSALVPDHVIQNLNNLLDIFPPRPAPQPATVYDASLSTMWAMKNFPALSDFFEGARRLGFGRIELNHQIDSAMLAGIDLPHVALSSIHEPCPADVSAGQLKARDWLISCPHEEGRRQGVLSIQRSIDLAHEMGVPVIVIHCGTVNPDLNPEKKLRALFEADRSNTDEYQTIKQNLIESRAALIGPRFEAVQRSLLELLDYASPFRIRLGLENRYHYFDIPTLDEMGELLALADPGRLGFVYDVGHAQTMDRLGFFSHAEWLRRYSSRMIAVHLHDVKGVTDHYAPGLGEVDFDRVASYLPEDAVRTYEVQVVNSPEQVKASLEFLFKHNCIKTI